MLRGDSSHMHDRVHALAAEFSKGNIRVESGKMKLVDTRKEVEQGWRALTGILVREGHDELANQIIRFVDQMSPARTEKEWISEEVLGRIPKTPAQQPQMIR